MQTKLVCAAVVLVSISFGGCDDVQQEPDTRSRSANVPTVPESESIIILVAASAKDAVEELTIRFEKQTGISVRVSPGPSNTLAAQIIAGAPADLFLSANQEWADSIASRGLSEDSTDLLSNDLVLITPRGNPGGIRSAADLVLPRVKRVALAGEKVPAGIYAQQALRALHLFDTLVDAKKIVRGQDVRVALNYVALGEAEAGIVYSTDARLWEQVNAIEVFDPDLYERIVYPLLLLKHEPPKPGARRLYDLLRSPEASAIYKQHGFKFVASPAAN